MEASPTPSLVVTETEVLLEVLVVALASTEALVSSEEGLGAG
jgi:hypothetical protein